jgi:hypothetical protein
MNHTSHVKNVVATILPPTLRPNRPKGSWLCALCTLGPPSSSSGASPSPPAATDVAFLQTGQTGRHVCHARMQSSCAVYLQSQLVLRNPREPACVIVISICFMSTSCSTSDKQMMHTSSSSSSSAPSAMRVVCSAWFHTVTITRVHFL